MGLAGYNVAGSPVTLLVLDIGAIAGLMAGGRIADRIGVEKVVTFWFVAEGIMLALLFLRREAGSCRTWPCCSPGSSPFARRC